MAAAKPHFRIRPDTGWSAFNWRELWEFRDVVMLLVLRDIKLRYKQTAFGIAWVILQPVLAGAIFAVVFGHFARLPSDGQPYLLFVFTGLLGWNLVAGVVQRSGNSLVAEARLITKVYFPRVFIPLASAGAVVIDFLVALLVFGALAMWHRTWPGSALALLPIAAALALALAAGVSLWISALNVRYRDFGHALPFLLQVWMYASPVVYGATLIPERWRGWFALNPAAGVLELFRHALLGTSSISPALLGASVAWALVLLATGTLVFRRVEREFADTL